MLGISYGAEYNVSIYVSEITFSSGIGIVSVGDHEFCNVIMQIMPN